MTKNLLLFLATAFCCNLQAGEPTPEPRALGGAPLDHPRKQSFIDFELGYLGKIGGDTPLDYSLVPAILTYRSPEVLGLDFANGACVIVRNRLSLIGEWVEQGPENHYFGLMGAPSIEWWSPQATWSLYAGIGGGAGWIDSQGVTGGQGQDFTLNWFANAGFAHALNDRMQVRVGTFFQHLSNGGATDPNPGLNSLGVTLGLSWGF
jgi:lipid A 3-O-deacylase